MSPGHATFPSTLAHLARTRRVLGLALALRIAGTSALFGAFAVAAVTLGTGSGPARWVIGGMVSVVVAAIESQRRGALRLTSERVALWVEERVPRFQYAVVSTLGVDAPIRRLERSIDPEPWRDAERRALANAAWAFGALVIAAAALLYVAGRLSASNVSLARMVGSTAPTATPLAPLHVRLTVTPPAYSKLPAQRLDDPSLVRSLEGSVVRIDVDDTTATIRLGDSALSSTAGPDGRSTTFRASLPSRPMVAAAGPRRRLLAVEVQPDSVPVVSLTLPARDTVLRTVPPAIPLRASLHDDYGLASATFEYILSSGQGESFTFRNGTIGARLLAGATRFDLAASLTPAALPLQLKPGDVLHIRAVARDVNDVTGPGIGRSETRTIRIARPSEYDSLAVEGAAPPEADKSVLSERMLINQAEALRRKRRSLTKDAFVTEATRLARDQARLRRQVGDIVFDRLGDAPGGEESRDADVDRPRSKEELLKAAEEATRVDSAVLDFEGDETPVVAVNRPLLEAYNAMWDAGRALGIAELDRALPHMYRALAAIQRARSAERLYLRGRAPAVVIDIARVRLQGKAKGSSSTRAPRASADSAAISDRLRFTRALQEVERDPSGAIDSLVMLRLTILDRNPSAARALERSLDRLRGGKDATDALLGVRRALDDSQEVIDSLSHWTRATPRGAR